MLTSGLNDLSRASEEVSYKENAGIQSGWHNVRSLRGLTDDREPPGLLDVGPTETALHCCTRSGCSDRSTSMCRNISSFSPASFQHCAGTCQKSLRQITTHWRSWHQLRQSAGLLLYKYAFQVLSSTSFVQTAIYGFRVSAHAFRRWRSW